MNWWLQIAAGINEHSTISIKKIPRRDKTTRYSAISLKFLNAFNDHGTGATASVANACAANLSVVLRQHVYKSHDNAST